MIVRNFLPLLIDCLGRWERPPTEEVFVRDYYEPMAPCVEILFDDFSSRWGSDFYSVLGGLDWKAYRSETLKLDPIREEERFRRHLGDVEKVFGFALEGEAVLFGAFACMDGYARFDRGTHRVFLGVDESHHADPYLDILETHELTHVARESRPQVWRGYGLDPAMTHDQFTECQPVLEHVLSEGFSCAVSQLLVPGRDPWLYAYQSRETLEHILRHAEAVDREVHAEISHPDGDYGSLYNGGRYHPPQPAYAHYVWGWQWVNRLLEQECGGDPARLVGRCSKDFLNHALGFSLGTSPLTPRR